jgi:hypothetical protein
VSVSALLYEYKFSSYTRFWGEYFEFLGQELYNKKQLAIIDGNNKTNATTLAK